MNDKILDINYQFGKRIKFLRNIRKIRRIIMKKWEYDVLIRAKWDIDLDYEILQRYRKRKKKPNIKGAWKNCTWTWYFAWRII